LRATPQKRGAPQFKRCAGKTTRNLIVNTDSPERKRWSQKVTESSNALDLEPCVFTLDDPRKIAHSLKESAERSDRKKAGPFRSAMSMLTFYINRAGTKLSAPQRERLEIAKDELRELYGKPRRRPLP
jgi:hypothetical protein